MLKVCFRPWGESGSIVFLRFVGRYKGRGPGYAPRRRLPTGLLPGTIVLHRGKLVPRAAGALSSPPTCTRHPPGAVDVLPVASLPLVDARATPAAGGVRVAAAPSRQAGRALQQPGCCPRGGGPPRLAATRTARAAPAGLLGAAVCRGASGSAGAAAVGTVHDHAGHGRVTQHARGRRQADPAGGCAGRGEIVPARPAQETSKSGSSPLPAAARSPSGRHWTARPWSRPSMPSRCRCTPRWATPSCCAWPNCFQTRASTWAKMTFGSKAPRAQPGRQGQVAAQADHARGAGLVQLGRDHPADRRPPHHGHRHARSGEDGRGPRRTHLCGGAWNHRRRRHARGHVHLHAAGRTHSARSGAHDRRRVPPCRLGGDAAQRLRKPRLAVAGADAAKPSSQVCWR